MSETKKQGLNLSTTHRPENAISSTPAVSDNCSVSVSSIPKNEPEAARSLIDARCQLTVTAYTRHSSACPKRKDKYWKRCHCPKWLYIYHNGTDRRISAKTRSWSRAERLRQKIEDSLDPVRMEYEKLNEELRAQRVLVRDGINFYLTDAAKRNLARLVLYRLRHLFFDQLLPWAENHGIQFLDELTAPTLSSWRSTWLIGPTTSHHQQRKVVTFFNFCLRQGWLKTNPASLLTRIQGRRRVTDYFTREEFEKIVQATFSYPHCPCKFKKATTWGIRIRVLVLLMRWSGLRVSDAVKLERSRLVGDGILLYQSKTGTPVFVPLPAAVAESLRNIPPGEKPNPRYFFWSGNGDPVLAANNWKRALTRLFKSAQIVKEDGTPKRCHPQMLRDTFAVEMLLSGVPIDQVSVLLGHSSVTTTEKHYAPWVRARQQQLEDSVRLAHAIQGITKSAA